MLSAKHYVFSILVALPSLAWAEEPFERWSLDTDVGGIWRVGTNTNLDYFVVPASISLRTPVHFKMDLGEGTLLVRSRGTLLTEWIAKGPEDYYFGFSASPSLEYWLPSKRTEIHFSIGGGIGYVNHKEGVTGAQGRDKTYNWFMLAGMRHFISDHCSIHAGLMFQHFSNLGATDPNPGLDGIGPVIGMSVSF